MAKIVGIDLGTTNSVIAVLEGGDVTVIPNAEGGRTTPSVVAFTKNGERLVGQMAKRQAVTNSENTVYSIKRFMGRRLDEVHHEAEMMSYKVVAGPNGDVRVSIPQTDKKYTPQEISAMILQKLKTDAEAYLGEPIRQAVITVPAYFNDSQRQATKDAGKIAGLEVLRIINEPTAASLAYGLDKKELETILVFDLGGGTFDVSVLEVGEGVVEVKATNGDTHLGGDDWDQRVVQWILDEFKKEHGVDLGKDPMALQRLKEAAEKAKIELSSVIETDLNLPFITADATGPKHLQMKLTRSKLDQLTDDLLQRCVSPFNQAIKDAGLKVADINEVVLVGGASRMPMVQDLVRKLTNGKEPHKGVNPDEIVAVGAALQAGVLSGEVQDVILLDVTPLTLGLETLGGVLTPLIEANTTIPVRKSEIFSTAADGQTAVEVKVYQGERPIAADNMLLGQFQLDGIPPAPRGLPQIEVSFDIDANGILNVAAKDKASGREQKITITASTNLSKDEVERLREQGRRNAAQDQQRKQVLEARNEADSMIYQMVKLLRDSGDKIGPSDRAAIEGKIDDLRRVAPGDNLGAIRSAIEDLKQASYAMSQRLYEQPAGGPTSAQSGGNGHGSSQQPRGEGEEVIEGEFREV
jgi:molecular chaperone DnaK